MCNQFSLKLNCFYHDSIHNSIHFKSIKLDKRYKIIFSLKHKNFYKTILFIKNIYFKQNVLFIMHKYIFLFLTLFYMITLRINCYVIRRNVRYILGFLAYTAYIYIHIYILEFI